MENEKIAQAVDKIDSEAAKAAGKNKALAPAYDAIAQMLRDAVRGNVRACECCLDAAKTVEGAYDSMKREAARKKDGGNCVVIAPDEAFDIIAKYYGFDAAEAAESAKSTESQAIANPDGDVESLFDLL